MGLISINKRGRHFYRRIFQAGNRQKVNNVRCRERGGAYHQVSGDIGEVFFFF